MMLKQMALLATALVVLTGCATAAHREGEGIRASLRAANEQAAACVAQVNANPAFAELERHRPAADIHQATLSQLTDQTFATSHEVDLISERRGPVIVCQKPFVDVYMAQAPALGIVWMERFSRADADVLQLAQRHISWGEYVTRSKNLADDTRLKLVATGQRLDADENARNQQELAQRAAAAQAFSQSMQQQQMINNMNRPVTTNCNRFGSSVSCTTY